MPLANKLTLLNVADGSRILTAYLSDNYFSLLPANPVKSPSTIPPPPRKAPHNSPSGGILSSRTVPIAFPK
jgi:hypothetical protein